MNGFLLKNICASGNSYLYFDNGKSQKKKMSLELIVAIQISPLSQLFLPVTICFLTYRGIKFPQLLVFLKKCFLIILCFPLKCDNGPFLHFPSPTFVYMLGISPSCGNKLQDFGWSICIFMRKSSSLLAVCDFKFPRHFDF